MAPGENLRRGDGQPWSGSPVEPGKSGPRGDRRWPSWWPLLVIALAAVAVAAVVQHPGKPLVSAPSPQLQTVSSLSIATSRLPVQPPISLSGTPGPPPAVAVTELGHPLLGVRGGWELFGRGDHSVVRIEMARGRVTSTAVPDLGSTGPVSFLAGPDRVIIRPLDFVVGYAVVDGRAAAELTGALAQGGPVFPGADAGHVWVDTGTTDHDVLTLVNWNGKATATSVVTGRGLSPIAAIPDGAGYWMYPFFPQGGVILAWPGRFSVITAGKMLAVGPTRLLIQECNVRCASVVLDRTSNTRRPLAWSPADSSFSPGLISPDGRTAAMFPVAGTPTGRPPPPIVHLVDLASGVDRAVPGTDNQSNHLGTMVWSPDSKWLFSANQDGTLEAVDASTGHVQNLGVPLPPVTQLAVRNLP